MAAKKRSIGWVSPAINMTKVQSGRRPGLTQGILANGWKWMGTKVIRTANQALGFTA